MRAASAVRFYFKKGRWRVTANVNPVPASIWWAAINEVKCLNHKLRMKARGETP